MDDTRNGESVFSSVVFAIYAAEIWLNTELDVAKALQIRTTMYF